MPTTRLELAWAEAHHPLKVACLPISPRRLKLYSVGSALAGDSITETGTSEPTGDASTEDGMSIPAISAAFCLAINAKLKLVIKKQATSTAVERVKKFPLPDEPNTVCDAPPPNDAPARLSATPRDRRSLVGSLCVDGQWLGYSRLAKW